VERTLQLWPQFRDVDLVSYASGRIEISVVGNAMLNGLHPLALPHWPRENDHSWHSQLGDHPCQCVSSAAGGLLMPKR